MNDPLIVVHRAVAVYQSLTAAGVRCALGGALSLAFHTDDPRATQDIDFNVSLPADRAREGLLALPADVPWDDTTVAAIERHGQIRIMWPVEGGVPIPLDLFFAEHELHDVVAERSVEVTLGGAGVQILSATDLTIFKALFDRPKDWVDIQAMLDSHDSTVDLADAASWVARIVGADDQRVARLNRLADPQK